MKKRIKRWGSSLVIVLTSEESKIYGVKVDDIVDIELVKVTQNDKHI